VSPADIPCEQFIPLDSWAQCEKRLFDNEWLTLTSANLTWVASPFRWSASYTNLSTGCDYFVDVEDYASCQKRAQYSSSSSTLKWFEVQSSNAQITNPYTTGQAYYDCWEFQTSKTATNCVTRAGGSPAFFFEEKGREIEGFYNSKLGLDLVSCPHYKFDECETANASDVAAQLSCKATACKAYAVAADSTTPNILNFNDVAWLDCDYYHTVTYSDCTTRAGFNSGYADSTGPLNNRASLGSKVMVRYKENGDTYYVDCF